MNNYEIAKAQFSDWSIDTEVAINTLKKITISMHCWQGDDVIGFEQKTGTSGGGIQATGNHPGRASTPDELRADLDFSYSIMGLSLRPIGVGLIGFAIGTLVPIRFLG